MGVMSIPCCAPTPPPKPPVDGGPVLVKAGWYHFLVMGIGGQVNTFVASPQLAYMTGTSTSDRKYWKAGWGNTADAGPGDQDVSVWPTQGSSDRNSKYLEGDRRYHPWAYADCSYDIATRKYDEDCPRKTINVEIETFGIVFYQHASFSQRGWCDWSTPNDPNNADNNTKCNQKCVYRTLGYYPFRGTDALEMDDNVTARPWYLQPYLNFNGTSKGMGVTLYDSSPGSKGLPELIDAYSPAQLAPAGHPLETPAILRDLKVKDIECGAYHNVVRLADNSIVAWGLNSMGQCNVPESLLPDSLRPAGVRPHPNRQNICSLHAGFSTTAVMFNDGTVLCWGDAEVADKVNQWQHIKTSLIKTNDMGIQDCCIGAPSVGYPECLPGTDCSKPENWVPENKYKTGRYNANNDWEGYWHNGASPAHPHFDLGVETEYVYPVNFAHVVKASMNALGSHGNSDVPAGPDIPGDTDETDETIKIEVPQYSYRYAKQWPSHTNNNIPMSRCAAKGKIGKDFAVGMLRTGQIVTTRRVNTPVDDKDRLYCRDCSQDTKLARTDGSYFASNIGPATNLDVHEYCTDGTTPDGSDQMCRFGHVTQIDCKELLTADGFVTECTQEKCESKERWFFHTNLCDGAIDTTKGDECTQVGPNYNRIPEFCASVNRPEGIGCFSSVDDEPGYDPNWQGSTRLVSAGHVRGTGNKHPGANNGTHPEWNEQQADYGWASLPTPQERFKPLTSKGYPIHPLCTVPGPVISACVNYFDMRAPCNSECPGKMVKGNMITNKSATPGLNGQGNLPGSAGFFHYPAHMHSFGCVAGTNAVTWLGPTKLLNKTLATLIGANNGADDIKLTKKASEGIFGYTQLVYENSYRTDVCVGCAHVGSHVNQSFNICKLSHGVIHNNLNPDPDGMINPLSGDCLCVADDCIPEEMLNTGVLQAAIKPTKSWGPFQIAVNLGIMPSPPIMEYGNIFDKNEVGAIFNIGQAEILWGKKLKDGNNNADNPKGQDSQLFFVTKNDTGNNIPYAEGLGQPEWFIANDLKLDAHVVLRFPLGNGRAWARACDCAPVCWADDDVNGQGDRLGTEGLGCGGGGNLDGSDSAACEGSYFYDCSIPPTRYNPNGKEVQKTGSGFTLYSPLPEGSDSVTQAPILQAKSPDNSKIVTCTDAVEGSIKLEIWNISENHKPSNVFIKSIILNSRPGSESDTFTIQTPFSINWMKDGTLLLGFGENTSIYFIEVTNIFAAGSISYKPIKFLTRHLVDEDGNPADGQKEWLQEDSISIDDFTNLSNNVAVDYRTSNKYLAFHKHTSSSTSSELEYNNRIQLYKPCDSGLCPPGLDVTDPNDLNGATVYNPSRYKYYIKVGAVPIFDALSVARRNALDFLGSTTGSELTPFKPECLKPNPKQCISDTDNTGVTCGQMTTKDSNGNTIILENCEWQYDEPWQWIYGGHADNILFTGTGDLVINCNDFYTTVYWGLKGITSTGEVGDEKLILSIDDTRYAQTAKYERGPVPTSAQAMWGAGSLLQGLHTNHVYVNNDSSRVGVVGYWDGDPLDKNPPDVGEPDKYWYSAAVTSYQISWGTTANSKFNPDVEISTTLLHGPGFDRDFNVDPKIALWRQNQNNLVQFDDTINFAIVAKFESDDTLTRAENFKIINLTEKSVKNFGDVFGDDNSRRSVYTSFGSVSGNRFFLTSNTKTVASGTDETAVDRYVPNGIVVDGNIDYSTNSYPLWNRRLCGLRACLGSQPFKGWTGGGNFGCADVFGFDNSPGINEAKTGFEIRDHTKGVNDLLCPDCDKSTTDGYSRWGFTHPTISFATGRSWSVHLRDLPWSRDHSRGSIFYKKHHCEESEEYGLSDYWDSDGLTKQKSVSHTTGNYDNIKIWVTGNMVDPCPPWPLKTWDPDNGITGIDIELPQPSTNTQTVVIGASTIGPDGLTYEEGTERSMTVRHCGKYPSWVPVPNTSVSDTDKQPGRSYKGIWRNGVWHSGLYGISAGKLEGFPIAPGISAENINDINTIVDAVGISAAYQSICVTCETAWTEPLPPVSNIVGRTFFRQGFGLQWDYQGQNELLKQSSCAKFPKFGACCKQDMSGITQCFYGTSTACGYTLGHIDSDVSLSWGFTAGTFTEGVQCDEITCS